MKSKNFFKTAGTIFGLAGAFHILRVILGWSLVIDGVLIHWVFSLILGLIVLKMSYWAFKFAKK